MIEHMMNIKIDGEEIQAKYYEFDSGWLDDAPNSLNLWDKITMPFYRIKSWVKYVYWKIRYGFQRMFKGYDCVDTFETFSKFTERYYKILAEYKKHHHGYPYDSTEEKWDNIVDDMLHNLYYMDEENVEKELSKDVPENWMVDPQITYEIMNKHKDEFFKLFSKYFYNLWD